MQLYKKLLIEMQEANKELFDQFSKAHEAYVLNMADAKEEFNMVGSKVVDIIRRYERKLVGTTERGGYAKFSSGLSDKFWAEIRKVYPKIDFVGVK